MVEHCDFVDAASHDRQRREHAAPRPRRPAFRAASTSWSTRRRRSPRTSTPCAKTSRRTSAARSSPTTRARCASTSRSVSAEGLLAPVPSDPRLRRHVPAGRVVPPRGARAGLVAPESLELEQVILGFAEHAHRAPTHGRDTWQQETIAESAREVSELGRELYKGLSTMGAHFSKLGRSLEGSVKSYNETVGSLERNVLPQARRFEKHGITGVEPPELQPDRAPDAAARGGGAGGPDSGGRARARGRRRRRVAVPAGTLIGSPALTTSCPATRG